LLTQTKNHYSYPILDNGISSFRHSYSNDGVRHHQQYLSGSSPSLTDPTYLQNHGSNLDTIIETETKEQSQPQPPFIKRILLVDDDPDITLTFKAGLDGHYYNDNKRFEVYTYNDPLSVVKEFKPHYYDLLLTDIYMPNMNGFQLCEKII
jgi:PleD family two-component response regulator